MPQVNLSSLNGRELRQLLDTSRRRGDAALSYSILQEMAARRDGSVARDSFKLRRQDEPRLVAVDLDDPMEKSDQPPPMPGWRPPSPDAPAEAEATPDAEPPPVETVAPVAHEPVVAAAEAAPPEAEALSRPLSLHVDAPEPRRKTAKGKGRRAAPRPVEKPPARRGVSLRVFAGFTFGIALGTAFGWWAGGVARDVLPPPAPVAAPLQTAALAPAPPPAPPSAAAETLPEAQAVAPVAPPPEPAAPPEAQDPVREAAAETSEPPAPAHSAEAVRTEAPAEPAPARPPPAVAKGCAAEPTPADRAICGDLRLQRLQRELRQAYGEALDAHQDRDLLRQRQLAWADARNAVTDPDRLARLYEARIRKLNAATAEARGEQ